MPSSKNSNFFAALEIFLDIALNFSSFFIAYFVAILITGAAADIPTPGIMTFAFAASVIEALIFMLSFSYAKGHTLFQRYYRIIVVNLLYYAAIFAVAYYLIGGWSFNFLIANVSVAMLISSSFLMVKQGVIAQVKDFLSKRGYRLRKVVLIGDNTAAAADFVKQVTRGSEQGMMILGYVGDKINPVVGCEKLGGFKDLARILDEVKPTDAVFAIDAYDKRHLIRLVNLCNDRCIRVSFLPVIYGFFKSPRQIDMVGTLPVIYAHATPLDDKFNTFIKRLADVFLSLALILLTAPIMLFAVVGVYLSSPGPILFRQERIGKLGKSFTMLKFRSMRVNVDSDSGWTSEGDTRKTKFGAFIRAVSIDELPQLFNVLRGDMSLVGPRPEIPYYVEYFRDTVPLYMVKHYVKPGITGLAQVRGLRGDTSIEERIHADIEYIENWSLGLDFLILLKTPLKAINKRERIIFSDEDGANTDVPTDTVLDNISREVHTTVTVGAEELTILEGRGKGKKILYAASSMSHITNFHTRYVQRLREAGFEVKILARGEGADYNLPFSKKMFAMSNAACRAEIKKILASERFDAIVLNTSLAAFHIRMCLRKKDRPRVVNIVHGYLFSRDVGIFTRTLLLLAEKLCAPFTDTAILMNRDDLEIARRHKLAHRTVFINGMGAEVRAKKNNPEALRRALGCEDSFVLCFVGELSNRKNQRFLINAMNDIKEKVPGAVLWLVGDGPKKEELNKLCRAIDLSESVHFLGQREDACDLMRACDLYVSASVTEGMPFNIIEAMGCKKTILASRVKGHTDLIDDGKTGFLYKLNSRREFCNKVFEIYQGQLRLDDDEIYKRYLDFANDKVFDSTYTAIVNAVLK